MAFKQREEIVGKRFVCVTSAGEVSRIADWGWKSGVVRASSHKDTKHRDLTILVEWDGSEWQRREWIRVYAESKYAAFLVEHTLVWAARHDHAWPALNFRSLVDEVKVNEARLRPLEFLLVRGLAFVDYSNLRHYHSGSEEAAGLRRANPRLWAAVQGWNEFQDGQRILLTTPSVLAGYRVAVYRAQGTTQWYTAVIGAYNSRTRSLTLTDDTVLEEHSEDPGLVQMKLLGDGVVESILKGESVGMRRRTNAPTPNGPYATRARGQLYAGYCKTRKTRNRPQYPIIKGLELNTKNNGEIKPKPRKYTKQHQSLNEPTFCEERTYKYKLDGSDEERDIKESILNKSCASLSPRTSPVRITALKSYDKDKISTKDKSSQAITTNVSEEEHAKMSHAENQSDKSAEEIYVYRDPHLVQSSTSKVRHVDSLQHHAMPPRPYLPMMLAPPPPNYIELMWQQHGGGSAWPNVYTEDQLRVLQSHIDRRDERDRFEREKLDKEERKRAQQEAVKQHFEESLRLANAKRQNMNRNTINTISRSAQVGINNPLISLASSNREMELREKAKLMETKERVEAAMQRNEHEKWHFVKQELKSSSEIRASIDKFPKPGDSSFNLYGYQPFQHTFVSQAQSTASLPSNNNKRTLQRQDRPSTPGCIKPSADSIVGGSGAFKPYEYSISTIPPAHQSSSSRCISDIREQPQNLVKSEPPTNTYNSLIQQGVLPNPLYNATTAGACITSGTPVCRPNSVSPQIRPYSHYNVRPPLVSPSPAHLHVLPHTPPPPLLTSQSSTISKSPILSCNTSPLNLQNPINSIRKKPNTSEFMCPKKRSKLAEEQLMPPNLQPQNSTSPSSVIKSETTCESPPSPLIEVSSPPPTLTTFIEPSPQEFMPIYCSKLEKSKNRLKNLQSDSNSPTVLEQTDSKSKTETNDQTATSSSHTKLKKAWLQRHSENEDKKSEPLFNIECEPTYSNSSVKEECLSPPCLSDSRSADNVNEEVETKEIKEESTSSASEGEKDAKGQLKRKPKVAQKSLGYKKRKVVEKLNQENLELYHPKSDENKRTYKQTHSKKKRARKGASNSNNTIESPKKNAALSTALLKRTGQTFLQDGPCYDIAPKLPKCRECRMTPHQRNKKMPNIFCRFYAYRKLKYGKNGTILNAGFSEPNDANDEDLCLWLPPSKENLPVDLDVKTSKFILQHVGDYFCSLVLQEKQALCLAKDAAISWKRVVQGVREQCDVCDTTLFNIHWVCHKCGFVVCMDCLKARQSGDIKGDESLAKDKDEYQWLLCSNRQPHEQDKLMITQIIAGSSLWHLGVMLHEIQHKWQIRSHCICTKLADKHSDQLHKRLLNVFNKCIESSEKELVNGSENKSPLNGIKTEDNQLSGYSSESGGSPLSWLADVALLQENKNEEDSNDKKEDPQPEEKEESHSTLRDLLIRPSIKYGNKDKDIKLKKTGHKQKDLEYIVENYSAFKYSPEPHALKSWSLEETSIQYPDIEHDWMCDGQVLLLLDPETENNIPLFQEVWSFGHPVIVGNVRMQHPSLWTPDALAQSFGDITTDLLNCKTGAIVSNVPLQKFWEGFENVTNRLKDDNGEPILLRLKDWPPGDELSDILPQAYKDLLEGLPLGQYTLRSGSFNMASHFPDLFARPDLGPRMCTAYGSFVPNATSGLQMDVCDSVNILIYVGYTKDESKFEDITEVLKLAGCDSIRRQNKDKGIKPGALWHIYDSKDSNKIREFLIKLSKEKGEKIPSYQDPLYDQVWYLDEHLRKRLNSEYGVEAYSIAQYIGDAIFIPAGAPHQVHNLYSCIRISSDFVSAENTGYSLQLTQESRHSTEHHFIHEDKLQIKNLMYHAVKDALSLLQNSETEIET